MTDCVACCAAACGNQGANPIIVLSSLNSEEHKVAALDSGADDYLSEPFGLSEFLARVRAVMRRASLARRCRYRVGAFILLQIESPIPMPVHRCPWLSSNGALDQIACASRGVRPANDGRLMDAMWLSIIDSINRL